MVLDFHFRDNLHYHRLMNNSNWYYHEAFSFDCYYYYSL